MLTILKPPPLTTELHGEPAGGDLLRRLVNGGRRSMQETPSNYCDSRNKNEDLVAWMLDSHPAGCLEDCLGINALVSKRRPRHFLSLTLWRVIVVRKSGRCAPCTVNGLHSGIHQSGMLSLKSELAIRFHLGAGHIGVHLTDSIEA